MEIELVENLVKKPVLGGSWLGAAGCGWVRMGAGGCGWITLLVTTGNTQHIVSHEIN